MLTLPPIPPYEGLHPIVVHFPIGILLIAWLPMLIALVDKKRRNAWLAAAAMLLIVGTLGTLAAVLTGEASQRIVGSTTKAMSDALHQHEETAQLARNLFIATTAVFLAVWIAANAVNGKKKRIVAPLGAILIAITYTYAALTLINTGHHGGLLVHEYGIHAPMGEPPAPPLDHADDHD